MHKVRKPQRRFFPEKAILQNQRSKLLIRSYEKMTSARHLHVPTTDSSQHSEAATATYTFVSPFSMYF